MNLFRSMKFSSLTEREATRTVNSDNRGPSRSPRTGICTSVTMATTGFKCSINWGRSCSHLGHVAAKMVNFSVLLESRSIRPESFLLQIGTTIVCNYSVRKGTLLENLELKVCLSHSIFACVACCNRLFNIFFQLKAE